MKRLALFGILFSTFLLGLLPAKEAHAQLACTFIVDPASGNETTNFNFLIDLCFPNNVVVDPINDPKPAAYRIYVKGTKGGEATFCVQADTFLRATLTIPGSGFAQTDTYNAEVQWLGFNVRCDPTVNQSGTFVKSVNFTVDVAQVGGLACGTILSVNPPPGTQPCEAKCPLNARTAPNGGGPIPGWFCECGTVGKPCCPPGNPGGLASCANTGTACVADVCSSVNRFNMSTIVAGDNCSIGEVSSGIGCIPYDNINRITEFFLRWSLGVAGGIALFLISISAVKIMTTKGDPKRLQDARDTLSAAIAGLVMVILSVFLVRFLTETLLRIF